MAVSKYDMVRLVIGYNTFVVPRKFAMLLFEASQGEDFYTWETEWKDGKTTCLVKDIPSDNTLVSIHALSPAQFHMGRIAWQDKVRAEEEKAKGNAST